MSLKTVDFSFNIKAADGSDFLLNGQPLKANIELAKALQQAMDKNNNIKYFSWAQELFKDGKVVLDEPSEAILTNFINTVGFWAFVQVGLVNAIESAVAY